MQFFFHKKLVFVNFMTRYPLEVNNLVKNLVNSYHYFIAVKTVKTSF